MTTHITYATAKALKAFCPELPEPMPSCGYYKGSDLIEMSIIHKGRVFYPAYQLHDLLSKEFCEAFAKKVCPIIEPDGFDIEDDWDIALIVLREYQSGSMPAVEAALMGMMGKGGI